MDKKMNEDQLEKLCKQFLNHIVSILAKADHQDQYMVRTQLSISLIMDCVRVLPSDQREGYINQFIYSTLYHFQGYKNNLLN